MLMEEYNMNFDKVETYHDDDGIAIDIILHAFGHQKIPVIYLESDECDKKMKIDINFIISHQVELHNIIEKEIASYTNKIYNKNSYKYTLMKIYLFSDTENEYGFLFNWSGDTEHGIGVKIKDLSVKKIGSAEIAFL